LAVRGSSPANYTLHSVLVQGGDVTSGHYVVYTRPDPDGDWFKFDDDNCTRVKPEEAIEGNFGQNPDELTGKRQKFSSAYMLVFVRDDKLTELLPKLNKNDIPQHLHARFEDEVEKAEQKRQEEESALTYTTLVILTEQDLLEKHQQKLEFPDLVNPYTMADAVVGTPLKVEKTATMAQLYEQVHAALDDSAAKPIEALRIFPFERRENRTTRPGDCLPGFASGSPSVLIPSLVTNGKMFGKHKCVLAAVRYADEPSDSAGMLRDDRILVTCKFYEATTNTLSVVKFVYPRKTDTVGSLHDEMVAALQLPAGTRLQCLEELKSMSFTPVKLEHTFGHHAQLQSGDILVWSVSNETTKVALEKLSSEITVEWRELSKPDDDGFTLLMDNRMNYTQTVETLATHLEMDDPRMLQLTQNELPRTYFPGGPSDKVLSTTPNKLMYIAYIPYAKRLRSINPILYYEKISTPISEFEALTEFDVQLLETSKLMSVTPYKVHGPEHQTAADLIKQVLAAAGSDLPLMNCRLVQSYWNQLTEIHIPHDTKMSELKSKFDQYRVEEIPDEERSSAAGDAAVKRVEVSHVTKILTRRHGIPFLFMMRDGETVGALRARLQKHMHVPKAEFAKWKLGHIVQYRTAMSTLDDKIEYYDDDEAVINFADLKEDETKLIFDHADKSKKESTWDNPGAIKIHN